MSEESPYRLGLEIIARKEPASQLLVILMTSDDSDEKMREHIEKVAAEVGAEVVAENEVTDKLTQGKQVVRLHLDGDHDVIGVEPGCNLETLENFTIRKAKWEPSEPTFIPKPERTYPKIPPKKLR